MLPFSDKNRLIGMVNRKIYPFYLRKMVVIFRNIHYNIVIHDPMPSPHDRSSVRGVCQNLSYDLIKTVTFWSHFYRKSLFNEFQKDKGDNFGLMVISLL